MFTQQSITPAEMNILLTALAEFETKVDAACLRAQQAGDYDTDSELMRKSSIAWSLRRKLATTQVH